MLADLAVGDGVKLGDGSIIRRYPYSFVWFLDETAEEAAQQGRTPALKSADGIHSGAMVAFPIDPDIAAGLALDWGEAAETLHLTLAYIGKIEALDRARVENILEPLAQSLAPIAAEVCGLARFDAADDPRGWPLVALVDSPELPVLRRRVVDALVAGGVAVAANHGFTPHITLAYVDADHTDDAALVLAAGIDPEVVEFDELVLGWGDDTAGYPTVDYQHNLYDPELGDGIAAVDGDYGPRFSAGPVVKADEEQRFTLAPMYPAAPDTVTQADLDAHKEFVTAPDLQRSVWNYMRKGDMRLRRQHDPSVVCGEVVEIMAMPGPITVPMAVPGQAPVTKTFPAGTVLMGTVWSPEVWPAVKAGEINGYSFGGRSRRLYVDIPT